LDFFSQGFGMNTTQDPKFATSNESRPLVSVIVPVYNEEKNVPELYRRLHAVIESQIDFRFEVVMLDNGSRDGSSQICRDISAQNPGWRYVRFSRNFGIEASFYAGAVYAQGEALLYLFSDLQDPPEAIPEMLSKWQEGNEVVYGVLTKRQDHVIFKSWGAYFAYRLIFLLSDVYIPVNATDFRLLSRPVIDTLKNCRERNRYMRGLTHWSGFRQASFEFKRSPRKHGKSNATLWWCIKYAVNAMITFSTKPLRFASFVGIATTFMSLVGGILYIIHTILTRYYGFFYVTPPPPGWATLVLLIFFFGGIQCLFLGIIGEYLAQVQSETKGRPIFVEAERKGF
jgi:glycosyltransferase involved in cell wall biosynthesis